MRRRPRGRRPTGKRAAPDRDWVTTDSRRAAAGVGCRRCRPCPARWRRSGRGGGSRRARRVQPRRTWPRGTAGVEVCGGDLHLGDRFDAVSTTSRASPSAFTSCSISTRNRVSSCRASRSWSGRVRPGPGRLRALPYRRGREGPQPRLDALRGLHLETPSLASIGEPRRHPERGLRAREIPVTGLFGQFVTVWEFATVEITKMVIHSPTAMKPRMIPARARPSPPWRPFDARICAAGRRSPR